MRQQKIVRILFILYLLFIYYNVLIPFQFNFDWDSVRHNLREIEIFYYAPRGHLSLTDFAGNILLFVPFGFLLMALFQHRIRGRALFLTLLLGILCSGSIEILQLFVEERHTSVNDLLTNTLGTLIGAGLATFYFTALSQNLRRLFYQLLDQKPFLLLLLIFAAAQAISALMPFTVSITPSHFKKSLKAVNLVPFSYHSLGAWLFNDPTDHDLAPFDWAAFFADLIYWAAVGYLLLLCYRIYWRDKPYGKMLLFLAPALYFSALEFAQLFISSRITDVNDILSGYLGILSGYGIYQLARPLRRRTFRRHIDLLKIPLVIYLLFLLYSGLQPFDFHFALSEMKRELHPKNLIPFYAYFESASLFHIADLVNSLAGFLPVSLYWSALLRRKGRSFRQIYPQTILAGFALGLFIEVAQLFSASRVGEITDVLSFAVSGGLGTWLLYYYELEVRPRLQLYRDGLLRL